MIVIAIIGVLAASLFPMMSGYMAKARDTARVSDLKNINTALFSYYQDTGKYIGEAPGLALDSSQGVGSTWEAYSGGLGVGRVDWEIFAGVGIKTLEGFYIPKLPKDPINQGSLYYQYEPVHSQTQFGANCSGAGNICAYIISAKMENPQNAQADLTTCNLLGIGHDYCLGAGLPNMKGY